MAVDTTTFFRYFAPGEQDRLWGMFVTTVGTSRVSPGDHYPPAPHPEPYHFDWSAGRALPGFQMVYIDGGGGWFECEGVPRRRIEAGDVFLLFPGVWHRYAPDEKTGWEEHWVGFDGPRLRELLGGGFLSRDRAVFRARPEVCLLDAFRMLRQTAASGAPALQPTMASLCELLIAKAYASRLAWPSPRSDADDIVQRVIQSLNDRLAEEVDVEGLARTMGVSYSWLRKAFARHTGMGPHQYQVELRLARARQMLADPDSSIKEIARAVGFPDEHYFSRLFHRKNGVTPGGWRRQLRSTGDDE